MTSKQFKKHGTSKTIYFIYHNKLENLDIRIVVNNAGVDALDRLNDLSLTDIIRMIELNSFLITSTMYLFLDKWVNGKNLNTNDSNSFINSCRQQRKILDA